MKSLDKKVNSILILNFIFILIIMLLFCKSNKSSVETDRYESSRDISELHIDFCINEYKYYNLLLVSENQKEEELVQLVHHVYDREFTEDEKYLLAKIAMAEAENQNIQTKKIVIMVVLNRVESEDFPDSISEVIFQNNGKTYEFSPVMQEGRWWTTEPNEECYKAVEEVLMSEYDYSDGALYFESCKEKDNWHSRNLTYLYQSEDLRFYK